MDKDKTLNEQDAPAKNTDNAFVRVGNDGKPEIPNSDSRSPAENPDLANNVHSGKSDVDVTDDE